MIRIARLPNPEGNGRIVQTVRSEAMKALVSPKELALAIGVSESSLKRWVDSGVIDASRTAGGHRRIKVTEAIRFIRETGTPVLRPEVLGLPELVEIPTGPRRGSEGARLLDLLKAGRGAEARGLLVSLYLGGAGVAQIIDGLVQEAMAALGELWRHDEEGIYIEHRATDLCLGALTQLRSLVDGASTAGPVALGGAPGGDPYVLPSMCVATVLASEGFRAINLGPDTPFRTLLGAMEANTAALVWISATAVQPAESAASKLAALAERVRSVGAELVVGGRARESLRPPSGVRVCATMEELASVARRVLTGRRPE